MSQLRRLRETWDALADDDPLWAILSHADKRGRQWELDEFFAAGEAEIAALDAQCSRFGRPANRDLAVDFGCGVGRLTRALATRYTQAVGVDISPVMLGQARRLNAACGNVRFVENAQPTLSFLEEGSVDLVYSSITLQHVPSSLQAGYVAEFLRVLAPGGIAVLQIASGYRSDWRGFGYRVLPNRLLAPLRRWVHDTTAAAEIHVISEDRVAAIVRAAGRDIIHSQPVDSAGRGLLGRLIWIG